jgi:hypothetical protein
MWVKVEIMVKIVRFLCIAGIVALLGLIIGFTEFEPNGKPIKITESEVIDETKEINLNNEIDEPKADVHLLIFDFF